MLHDTGGALWLGLGLFAIGREIHRYHKNHAVNVDNKIKDLAEVYTQERFGHLVAKRFEYQNSLNLPEWKILRDKFIRKEIRDKGKLTCQYCGKPLNRYSVTVDHILSRFTHPELTLVESNLRIACQSCNSAKGARNNLRPIQT